MLPQKFSKDDQKNKGGIIKVVGVGGAGGNAINRMIETGVQGAEFIAVNTDLRILELNKAPVKIQIGANLTKGLGAGGDPKIGEKSALESEEIIKDYLQNSNMIFITAGMGGGTGTGASPIIAEIARNCAELVVSVVTLPFGFEGRKKRATAIEGVEKLKEKVDAIILINNDKLLQISDKSTSFNDAFKMADEVLKQAIQGVTEIVNVPGLINIDFNDLCNVMSKAGTAYLGIGIGKGENRAKEAAKMALQSPILDVSISGAKGVVYNVTGGNDLTLSEISEISEIIVQNADPEANIKFGAVIDPSLEGIIKVTLVATGFDQKEIYREDSSKERREVYNYNLPENDIEIPAFLRRKRQL
ncbi:MAG: cell division protein FtsZ [Dictyoglomaceae bacterium]|nr:cell division protein FtsZ [Dictyoglomaceae bacterium]